MQNQEQKRLLFVNACPRGSEISRTEALARHFLAALAIAHPDIAIIEHNLSTMGLMPISAPVLAEKERLSDLKQFDTPNVDNTGPHLFKAANDLMSADYIIVAAPYWDLSFPAILKVWVENIWVRNLTFSYRDNLCCGHLKASKSLYITTAGDSVIGRTDWGYGYIKEVFKALGVGKCGQNEQNPLPLQLVCGDGLDLEGADTEGILTRIRSELADIAASW